jgi:hypothetical protein
LASVIIARCLGARLSQEAALNHRKIVTRRVFLTSSGAAAGALFAGGGSGNAVISHSHQNTAFADVVSAPETTSTEIVLDNPRQAKLATEETVLAGPIDADQTTFDVITSGGAPWTINPAEFSTITGA